VIAEQDVAHATALLEARKNVREALNLARSEKDRRAAITVSTTAGSTRTLNVRAGDVCAPLLAELRRLEIGLNRLGVRLDEVAGDTLLALTPEDEA
jgi:class 3 adenylate cyclase